jgi:hypothetical protein
MGHSRTTFPMRIIIDNIYILMAGHVGAVSKVA